MSKYSRTSQKHRPFLVINLTENNTVTGKHIRNFQSWHMIHIGISLRFYMSLTEVTTRHVWPWCAS